MRHIAILLAGTAITATAASAETWDMPMAYPASNFHSEIGAAFAECVTDGTSGALEIVTHPGGSLFAGNDIKRAVQTGQVNIGERLLSAHANENPLFGIDSIPFLATSFADSAKLWQAAKEPMAAALDAQNLVQIYTVPWPPQGLYTKKDVNSVDDLAGVKFRAYNAATARIAELAGMAPVQIEAAELSQALATGVAESFISSGATGVDSKVWESLTHFYNVQAWLPRNAVMVNKDAWNALDDATRTVISECGAQAASDGAALSEELASGYLKTLADNGMTVADPGDQLREELNAIGQTMTEEWADEAGPEGLAIIETYREM